MTIDPTTTMESAARAEWDVIVIGAGPAGSFAARELALAGTRTLLVDRKAFPRPKVCGACVNGHAIALLESKGLAKMLQSLPAVPLRSLDLRCGRFAAAVALPGGVAVSRTVFDAALVKAAVDAGAEFLPETTALIEPAPGSEECLTTGWNGNLRAVRLCGKDRMTGVAEAKIVLVADGLAHSSLKEHSAFESRTARNPRIGIGATLNESLNGSLDDYPLGTVFMAIGPAGYVGLVRTGSGELNMAAAMSPEHIAASGGPTAAVAEMLAGAGLPALPGFPSAAWQGTVPLNRRPNSLAGRRIFLLGDAAGYVEPFTGEGIAWAFSTAAAVAPLALAGLSRWDERLVGQWRRMHRQLLGRRQQRCRLLAAFLRHQPAVQCALGLLSRFPALAGPLVRMISGSP